MIFWVVGLSGSGKTTLGTALSAQLRAVEPNTVLLDGDALRNVLQHDLSNDAYTVAGRRRNAERMTALCEMLDQQGLHVVCCILSIFPDMRRQNRLRFSKYFEIFMDAPLEVLQRRDVKGLYAKAARGEIRHVVGVDIPFERPTEADLIIDTSGEQPNVEALAADVLSKAGVTL